MKYILLILFFTIFLTGCSQNDLSSKNKVTFSKQENFLPGINDETKTLLFNSRLYTYENLKTGFSFRHHGYFTEGKQIKNTNIITFYYSLPTDKRLASVLMISLEKYDSTFSSYSAQELGEKILHSSIQNNIKSKNIKLLQSKKGRWHYGKGFFVEMSFVYDNNPFRSHMLIYILNKNNKILNITATCEEQNLLRVKEELELIINSINF